MNMWTRGLKNNTSSTAYFPGSWLTSHQTHYGSYQGRVFTGQMIQPTVSEHWRTTYFPEQSGKPVPAWHLAYPGSPWKYVILISVVVLFCSYSQLGQVSAKGTSAAGWVPALLKTNSIKTPKRIVWMTSTDFTWPLMSSFTIFYWL